MGLRIVLYAVGALKEARHSPCVLGWLAAPLTFRNHRDNDMTVAFDWKKVEAVAPEIVALLMEKYADARGVHVETIVGAAAALAGATALRAVHPIAPGHQYVLSAEVDDLLFEGKAVGKSMTGLVLEFAEKSGLPPDCRPDIVEIRKRVVEAFGSKSYPPLSVSADHYPREWSPNATVRLRAEVDNILAKGHLSKTESAVALACSVGALINMTAKAVDPQVTTTLALEILVGVSRMRPLAAEI
jgi:hypothetical protein